MLNTTGNQGNTSQNYNELPPHTHQDGYYPKTRKQRVLVWMWGNWNRYTVLVGT